MFKLCLNLDNRANQGLARKVLFLRSCSRNNTFNLRKLAVEVIYAATGGQRALVLNTNIYRLGMKKTETFWLR